MLGGLLWCCVMTVGAAKDATAVLRERLTLNDGNSMPRVGLGVYKSEPGAETFGAVAAALKAATA